MHQKSSHTQLTQLIDERMNAINIDAVPGFRRRVHIEAAPTVVCAELEDDFHCMGVRVQHDGTVATAIIPIMVRAPWVTCPGAIAVLKQTFEGTALKEFVKRGDKQANCTHLHDLALIAGAHAFDATPLTYDILVCDPSEGRQSAQLRCSGATMLSWTLRHGRFEDPSELAGMGLNEMRSWIKSLDQQSQEMARMLRWGTMIAHGRLIHLEGGPPRELVGSGRCYSFQPNRLDESTRRIGDILDFSQAAERPLAHPPLAHG